MTDLIVSALILAAWIVGCAAYYARTSQLRHRRAHRALRRRIRAYRATRPDNIVRLAAYSRKV